MNEQPNGELVFGRFALAGLRDESAQTETRQKDLAEFKVLVCRRLRGEPSESTRVRFRFLTRNLLPVPITGFVISSGLRHLDFIQTPWSLKDVRRYWYCDHIAWDAVDRRIYCPQVVKGYVLCVHKVPGAYLCSTPDGEILALDPYGICGKDPTTSAPVAVYRGIVCDLWDSTIAPATPSATVLEDESEVVVRPSSLVEDQRPIGGKTVWSDPL